MALWFPFDGGMFDGGPEVSGGSLLQVYLWLEDLNSFLSTNNFTSYPGHYPQDLSIPGVVYNVISSIPDHTLNGASGLCVDLVRFECVGGYYPAVVQQAEDLRLLLDGYRGVMGQTTILNAKVDQDHGFYDPPAVGSDTGTYRKTSDVYFYRRQQLPVVP